MALSNKPRLFEPIDENEHLASKSCAYTIIFLAKSPNSFLLQDLICDLLSPLFVSGIAAGVDYTFAAAFLGGLTVVSFIFEVSGTLKISPHVLDSNGITFLRWF